MKQYKIRMHTATMNTRYGDDVFHLFDDPDNPTYSKNEVVKHLLDMAGCEEDTNGESGYPYLCEGDVGAYFEYKGFIDIEIPESIVKRILNKG